MYLGNIFYIKQYPFKNYVLKIWQWQKGLAIICIHGKISSNMFSMNISLALVYVCRNSLV
jgi:hypothetical protein